MKRRFIILSEIKKSCLLIIFSRAFILIKAQPGKDGAIRKLQQHPQQDSIRVELLIDACVNTTISADTTYLNWAKEAMELSDKIEYSVGKIRALNCMGNYFYQRALHDKAISY